MLYKTVTLALLAEAFGAGSTSSTGATCSQLKVAYQVSAVSSHTEVSLCDDDGGATNRCPYAVASMS